MTTIPIFPLNRQASFLLEGPAGRLEVVTTHPEHAQKSLVVAVICHPHPLFGGNLNNKVIYTLARSFQTMGFCTLRFNFRGVGKSQGSYDGGVGETEDLLALLQWLKIVCPDHAIWLAGFSFGAYIAACAAKKWPVERLVCVAPPIEKFPFKTLLPFPCPWILIQGDKDEIVSPAALFSWVASLKTNLPHLITIKGAAHFFHGQLIELREQLIKALTNDYP
jgi:alpha/beta superfamily hydrolase